MDEMEFLTPFLSALADTIKSHHGTQRDETALDQKFKSLVLEKVAEVAQIHNESPQHTTGRVIRLPVRKLKIDRNEPQAQLEICRPLPDEIIQGWLGRMHAINCISPKENIEELIANHVRSLNRQTATRDDLFQDVADVLAMEREHLLKQHTLTQFFNCLSGLKVSGKPGTKSIKHKDARERYAAFSFGGKNPRYCWQCAQEDLSSLGFSYWRRTHQIPGFLWCAKHNSHLIIVARRDAFNECPHEITDTALNEKIHGLSSDQTKLLKRYAFIANEIFEQMPEIDSRTASVTLGKMAKAADLRFSKAGVRPTVSNHLMERLPIWWLKDVSRVTWVPNKYISTVDGICSPDATRYTTVTLSLLAALFYEDGEVAVAEILKPPPLVPSKTLGSTFWGSKKVFEEYVAQKGVVTQVAKQLSMLAKTTSVGLLNQGLPSLRRPDNEIRAAHAFLSGESLDDACKKHNTPISEVEAVLRFSGTKLKTALDKIQGKSSQNSYSDPSINKHQR